MTPLLSQSEWAERARAVLPGGGFGNFDPSVFIREGHGARVTDEDGQDYVDYLIGSGPMLLGHGHPEVLEAIHEQLPKGMTFFANNAPGIELAEEICRAVPCAEQLRYVSSGGEADMYAMRLARAFTGRDKIVKFEGGYHGMSAEAQMSLAPLRRVNFPQAVPDSAGIPASVAAEMLIAPFNDPDYIRSLLAEHGHEVAAIIVEPIQGEGGFYPVPKGFIGQLREVCDEYGIVLIVDEIQTGYARTGKMFAVEYDAVEPDIITLAKGIAGGYPIAAVSGKAEIMDAPDPGGLGGTYAASPLGCVAGLKVLEIIERESLCDRALEIGERLQTGLAAIGERHPGRVGDIRGKGAMVAMELVHDGDQNQPDANLTADLVRRAGEAGLLLISCGVRGNTIRILVPLTIPFAHLDEGLDILGQIFDEALA